MVPEGRQLFGRLPVIDNVLQTGRIVLEGRGEELLQSDRVRQAYLGM